MAPPTARRRHAKVALAAARAARELKKRREQRIAQRDHEVAVFCHNREGLCNEKGRSRTYEENRIALLTMMISMQLWMELIRGENWGPLEWTWSRFDSMVGVSLFMKPEHCRRIVFFCC